MGTFTAILLVLAGLFLVIYFSEQLVKGLVGTALHFRVSAFLLSVIFIGFDPENLGVGATGAYEGISGIAFGAIIGAAMVAIALALGITALLVPLKFKTIPRPMLFIPLGSVLLFALLTLDHHLGRMDGIILLAGYGLSIIYLMRMNKQGIRVEAGGEVAESLEREKLPKKWVSMGLMALSLLAIIGGSELLVNGSGVLLNHFQLSDTFYGMTILAFMVSIEELARELPAALKGKPDISIGNVIGSIMAFFLFNAGVIGLVQPVRLAPEVWQFYLPITLATVAFILTLLATIRQIPRWAGIVLVLAYVLFVLGGNM